MSARLSVAFLWLALLPQFLPIVSTAAWQVDPTAIVSNHDWLICGGSSFLHSEAYQNVMEAYGLEIGRRTANTQAIGTHLTTERLLP